MKLLEILIVAIVFVVFAFLLLHNYKLGKTLDKCSIEHPGHSIKATQEYLGCVFNDEENLKNEE